VIVFPEKLAETPAGSPAAGPIPVAPVVVNVMFGEIAVLMQSVGFVDGGVTVLLTVTVIVPVAFTVPHPPVNGIEYGKVPEAVGVPLTVIVFPEKLADTPEGSPLAAPIPVAPVVVKVIFGEIAVLMQIVGFVDGGETVLFAVTVIVPIAFTVPHPPVNGIV
jgi:hypothetical protein